MQDKKTIRKQISEMRSSLTAEYMSEADRAILEHVCASVAFRRCHTVFIYVSMAGEPDTLKLIEQALAQGKQVCVPKCGPDHTMDAVEITSPGCLQPGYRGILEPADCSRIIDPADIDLGIIPCVSAGRDFSRIGHGAGFYDRFLARSGMRTLCLCYGKLLSDSLPMEADDRYMDIIITEKGALPTPLQSHLMELADPSYRIFQQGLIPDLSLDRFIGVRIPMLRRLAHDMMSVRSSRSAMSAGSECGVPLPVPSAATSGADGVGIFPPATEAFLSSLPHEYYDEDILHAIIISNTKDPARCLQLLTDFLPSLDNWSVCDTLAPKALTAEPELLLAHIRKWSASPEPYVCRLGLELLMRWFLDEAYRPEYLEIPASVVSSHYYVNMMIAWFYATAMAKHYGDVLPYLTGRHLPLWVHNKTIQKAVESFRITPEQKAYLKTLRIRK